jgi:hypothetical protein
MNSPQQKTFKTAPCAEMYLQHSTEPHDVQWFEDAPPLKRQRVGTAEKSAEQSRAQRKRERHG